jgi:hypothetical protein
MSVPVSFGKVTTALDGSVRDDGLVAGSVRFGLSANF